ncbi:hypothetical protein FCV24_14270 [Clostridium botulinum]|uniref:hypothetical protein n=1 Tax=Clostridium botulinum TaxID=1491 RepID=UPI0005F95B0E|nr:hypothetical protein [Clostridium botulinum]MBY6799555.1 hypothetical protein [Clostridium botulinum]NFF20902.1 hypothetical protein [Clostridium botulinum]NFM75488.1 hypothetical protein [Clostridium botulinum]NFP81040.1 hypothetical protein [Clostridium botulinum]NFP94012.1 hypothetical protein [Clostridium botulinum]
MSEETKHLKLFKYDKETDDFNTTTFNIKKCLNDNWDKIDLQSENTHKDISEIKLKDEEQQQSIDKMIERLTFMSCKRESKQGKYYTQIRWYRKDKTLYAYSTLYQDSTSTNEYIPKSMEMFFYGSNGSTIKESIKFDLIFNSEDGDLIEMRLI